MVDQLLQKLARGGTHSYADLTRALGVSEELLQQMIEDLAQMGYLKAMGDGCQAKCEGCHLAGICTVGGGGQVWSLTAKGSHVAQELQ
jgi:Mn-dependent DtxR family transcriptional regulator